MRVFYSLIFIFSSVYYINAQNGVAINNTGSKADSSAILDVSSSSMGFLLPRMTTAERNAIVSPASGLLIYNTTTRCFEFYEYGVWQPGMCASCIPPSEPAEGIHIPSQTQIVWDWDSVSGATGYKWNTVDDYGSATDVGISTTYTQIGLSCNTSYTLYVWAYNSCSNSSSTELSSTTSACPAFSCGDLLVDTRDSKSYNTILIGTQCWMKENLNIGTYVTSAGDQTSGGDNYNTSIEKYCWGDNTANCTTYGGLYQWAEAVAYLNGATNITSWSPVPSGNVQGICPSGWHLPSDAEWCTLENYIEPGTNPGCSLISYIGTTVGNKMKEAGTLHWNSPSAGTNTSGFTALPGGCLYPPPTGFSGLGNIGRWWSSTENSATKSWKRDLEYNYTQINRYHSNKNYAYAVRCVKD